MDQNESDLWDILHVDLKTAMQQELSLTRELLSNMHQEEQSLIVHDPLGWNQVMQQRIMIVDRLSRLRLQRIETTAKIQKSLKGDPVGHTLEEMLPLNEEISYEIFNLRDQLIALAERMNLQQHRNHHLIENCFSLPSHTSAFAPQPTTITKPRITVTTYEADLRD